ncbi:MAG: CocE/NonD family hydrolase [Phycisphaerae bacterium]
MNHRSDLPRNVRTIENLWIPMSDGVKLAARVWMPDDAEDHPVPAILEYIPYRKRDGTRQRDNADHGYLAGHGYACVRLDIRGSGDSEGVLTDEYLKLEQDDAIDAIRWLADQPWCDGNVGMRGISWGGFNGLQVAARQPEPLKAIVTVCSTDDRYADDIHYMGGCLLGDNLSWASVMFAYNSCPPDPAIVGEDRWREMWQKRLEESGLWIDNWLRHQRRDEFWKHGSVCEDFSDVKTPVLAVSGWADGYSNAVFRLMENLDGPRQGLVGPWSHRYPHMGIPGPAIGFLQESLRWWDHWLKGKDTGIMDEPMIRAYMQDTAPPSTAYQQRPGRWVGVDAWPSANVEEITRPLDEGFIGAPGQTLPPADVRTLSPLSVGLYAGKWCSYSGAPDLPHDQREEDGGAIVFETAELNEDIEILGAPCVDLQISCDQPQAMAAVRLSDVRPGGQATRVTYGLLNLTHRDSHEQPEPLEPGKRYTVRVGMNDIAQRFPAGHKIRVSVSTSYWPLAWPSPQPAHLTIHTEGSQLTLPVRQPQPIDEQISFAPPETGQPATATTIDPGEHTWEVRRNLATDEAALEVTDDNGVQRLDDIGTEVERRTFERYSSCGDDVTSAVGEVESVRSFHRDDWDARAETRTFLSCDKENFYIHATLDAYEGRRRVFSENWNLEIPRDHV